MSAERQPKYDKNVSPNWKPVEGLESRKPGMPFSDRLWHWLISLGGLAIVACGIALIWFVGLGRLGGLLVGIGLTIFVTGFPNQAQRNGYRE